MIVCFFDYERFSVYGIVPCRLFFFFEGRGWGSGHGGRRDAKMIRVRTYYFKK